MTDFSSNRKKGLFKTPSATRLSRMGQVSNLVFTFVCYIHKKEQTVTCNSRECTQNGPCVLLLKSPYLSFLHYNDPQLNG